MSFIRPTSEKLLTAKPEVREDKCVIRVEEPRDAPEIRNLLEACFPGFGEADLVDQLRHDGKIVLSLVAEDEGVVIGAVCFSRLNVETHEGSVPAVALAPLAVYTEYQSHGVATRLVRESHVYLPYMGETLSVVLGEPGYYGRFGYSHRRAAHFASEYQSPYLMAISFGAAPWEGRLVYPSAFARLGEEQGDDPGDDAALQADG